MKSLIETIRENDPSYNPLTGALVLAKVDRDTWNAACSRVYSDGYYGPISDEDWKEQDGRKPYSVKEAIKIIATVLANVEDYYEFEFCEPGSTDTNCAGHRIFDSKVDASVIRAELIPFYKEIYGVGYPQL